LVTLIIPRQTTGILALFRVDFMSEHGQEFNGNVPPSSADGRGRLLCVFKESLRCID
jgi:hypothetical protein